LLCYFLQPQAIRIRRSILIEDIKFSARAWPIFIDRAAPAFFFIMSERYARCSALLRTLHTREVLGNFASELCRDYANAIACNFSVVKTHPKMLATLAAFKTRV
jgi:hypothetical protein